jgi:hypothetical protein
MNAPRRWERAACDFLRPPATQKPLQSESFFESLSCRHPLFPDESGGCDESYSGSFHGTVRRVLAPGSRGFVSLGFETAHEMPACPVSWSRMSHLPGVMMASPEKPLPSRRPKSARYRVRRTSAVARALKKSAGPSHVRLVTIPPREARTFLWQTSGTFRKVSNGQDTSVLLHSGNLLPQA